MNKTIKLYKKRKFIKIINIILIVVFIEFGIMGISGIKEKKAYSSENLITLTGDIRASYIEGKDLYVKLDTYDYHFKYLGIDLDKTFDYSTIIGKDAIVICSSLRLDDDPVMGVSLTVSNLELIDGLNTRLQIGQNLMFIGFISAAASIITMAILSFIKRKRVKVDVNYVEMGIRYISALPNPNINNELKVLYRKRTKSFLYYLIGLIATGLSFYIMYLITNLDSTFDILLSIGVSVLVLLFNSLLLYYNNEILLFHKDKFIDTIIARYNRYLDESFNEEVFKDSFGEEGIIVVNDDTHDEIQVPYDKLNMSIYVKYSKDPMKIRIFMVTDLDEVEYGFLQRDLIVELDGSVKRVLEEHDIHVKGYEYLMNNLKEELKKYLNSDKIINYDDKD